MQKISISAIICTYNRASLLRTCLESLVEQTLDASSYEVIVVDNNSTDNTKETVQSFAQKHPNIRLLTELAQGASQARNRGWKEARGTYVAFIDDDAKATPEWLERIVNAFETVTPSPVVVGGEIHPYYTEKMPDWFTDDLEIRTWGAEKGFLKTAGAQFGFSESNLSFHAKVFVDFGGFSSDFGKIGSTYLMGEGAQLCQRIYQTKPYFWYDPAIKVYHHTPRRNAGILWRAKRFYANGISQAKRFFMGMDIADEETKASAELLLQHGLFKVLFWHSEPIRGLREIINIFIFTVTLQKTKKNASIHSFLIYSKEKAMLLGKYIALNRELQR